jgi:hypothetical protein
MIGSEIRQARKGATVVADSCAGMWLSGLPPMTRHTNEKQQDRVKKAPDLPASKSFGGS